MMKIYIPVVAASFICAAFTSCTKDVLDKVNLQSTTADQIFNDSSIVKLYIDNVYEQNLPTWFGNTGGSIGSAGNGLTDEQYSDNEFVKGTATIESVTDIGTAVNKGNNYGKIRNINTFIKQVQAGTLDQSVKNRFIAQALFFRAFRYFDLVRLYGGVPLVLDPLEGVGQDAKDAALLPRNKTSECIQQIVNDLDTAIKYLPERWPVAADYGRITSGAAAAFKGRVLLTYASPQFNPSNSLDRWQKAYDANQQAVTILSRNGYKLMGSYDQLWFKEKYENTEAVMVTEYNTSNSDNNKKSNTYDNQTRPAYLGTSGGSNQPTWDLAQAYPMLDGKAPGTSSKYPYSTQTFYKNRDPRFNKTIAYNGCTWYINGNSNYKLWTYYYYYTNDKGQLVNKSTEATASSTGLYLKKAIDSTITAANLAYSGTDWIEIRYAEVLLNLGECAAEIGHLAQDQEAYGSLIAIRKRAGIEAGSDGLYGLTAGMGREAMINAIMNERRIEFAFEGKRFWDLRRRKLLESTLNGKRRTKMTIMLKNTQTNSDYLVLTRDGMSLDDLYSNYFTITISNLDSYNIAYQPGVYFFGIPTNAITNNPKLLQNNTWPTGTFDPLQ